MKVIKMKVIQETKRTNRSNLFHSINFTCQVPNNHLWLLPHCTITKDVYSAQVHNNNILMMHHNTLVPLVSLVPLVPLVL